MKRLGYSVARPFLVAATDAALGFSRLPVAADEPRVHAAGPNPDRLLLLGTASAAGVGVVSHQLGLGGQLARRLSAITGRGVDLEITASVSFTMADALEAVTDHGIDRFDAVVFMVGSRESIALQPVRLWEAQLRDLISRVLETPSAPHLFIVETPPIAGYVSLPHNLAERLRGHTGRQNAATAAVCAEMPETTFLTLGPPSHWGPIPLGSALYEAWASALAPVIGSWLVGSTQRRRPLTPVDEPSRQAALDSLQVVDSATDARIDRIARTARDLLGASGASVTFLDHERQWIKSAVSMSHSDTARASSFCNTTIRRPELFVVEDAAEDDEFAGHPWVVGAEQVRFYAGYPVEAPNGERVGALCVVDTKPRHFSGAEAALLRELALRVQTLLWAG